MNVIITMELDLTFPTPQKSIVLDIVWRSRDNAFQFCSGNSFETILDEFFSPPQHNRRNL